MKSLAFLKEKFARLPTAQKVVVVVLSLILFFVSIGAGYLVGAKKLGEDKAVSPKGKVITGSPEEPKNFANPINGVLFKKSEAEIWANQLPIGVMIENHTLARPQKGLSKAEVVYEALAEGGITRHLAVFLQNDTELGPIRSARPYYLDWIVEYGGAYAHFGGSPDALAKIKTYGIKDIDGLVIGAPTFERTSAKAAPHNVYSTVSKLREKAGSKGYKKDKEIESWKFLDKEPARAERPAGYTIKLGFKGTFGYNVEWRYNPETNSYLRFNGTGASIEALDNSQIDVKTIIVQTVPDGLDPSGHSRLTMQTVGSGGVKIFLNGTVVEGSWKKDSREARTKFFDTTGAEIKLNRGKIWVEIIPPGSSFTYP